MERVVVMKDRFDREIDYLRISITDRCNLRCKYCMPTDIDALPMKEILTYEEILEIARTAVSLGITRFKVTGGEPLVRKGCVDFLAALKTLHGVEKVSITTNGILLKDNLERLKEIGIDGINISLDTMDEQRYLDLTGKDAVETVLEAIHASVASGIRTKVNAVCFDYEKYERDYIELIELTRTESVDVRFIEIMPIGYGREFASSSYEKLPTRLKELYPGMERDTSKHGEGPAIYYRIPGYVGSIGLISSIHNKFCESCNRVRLTGTGYLKTCLCFKDGVDLKTILRGGGDLKAAFSDAVFNKPAAHVFDTPEKITEVNNMISIGG